MNFLQNYDAMASLPEVVLACLAMLLLMYGVFKKGDANDHVTLGAVVHQARRAVNVANDAWGVAAVSRIEREITVHLAIDDEFVA